ncbi:MAG: hypothetical protein JW795_21525 [Chitinivibrionales bacterium]|nr:hypothetical protein [Chitinivibrionales bacterium]
MVLYTIDQVTDDMVLGRSIFLPTGELLLAAGFRLNERLRRRLKQFGFNSIYIQQPGTEDIIPESIISEHVQREANLSMSKNVNELQKSFNIHHEGIQSIRKTIRDNRQYLQKFLTNSGFINILEKIIDEILSQPSVILNMMEFRQTDNHLLSHALSVTVTALAIGRKYHYSYEELKQLAIGAVNYDLGLIAIPKQIREKKVPLTGDELEIYKQHTVYGYLMLSQNPSITPTSAAVALQHHEFQDGSGYPRNLKGENLAPLKDFSRKNVIHRFSEVVAVADMYNSFIYGKMGPAWDIRSAQKKMIEMAGEKLNRDVVKCLASIVAVYPVGTRIRITEAPTMQLIGYFGAVAQVNPENLESPQIVLYETKNHQRIKPILIDLASHRGFTLEVLT